MNYPIDVFIFTQSRDAILYRHAFHLFLSSIVLCIGLYRAWRVKRKIDYGSERITSAFAICLALLSGTTSGFSWYSQSKNYSELNKIYNDGTYSVVEGSVLVLHEQPYGGHARGDVIVVDNIEFEFSYFSESFGYHQTISRGGILKQDAVVRLAYSERPAVIGTDKIENLILRVQLLESP